MKNLLLPLAAFALVASAPFNEFTASAQQSKEAQKPYEHLANVYASDVQIDEIFAVVFGKLQQYIRDENYVEDEDILALETECPGTIDAIFDAIKPEVYAWFVREIVVYRQDLTELFSAELTRDDAVQAAKFFDSNLGRKMMLSISQSISVEHSIASGMLDDDDSIDNDALEQDALVSVVRGMAALNEADRNEIEKVLGSSPWSTSWDKLYPKLLALGLEVDDMDVDDDTLERASLLAEATMENRAASCPSPR